MSETVVVGCYYSSTAGLFGVGKLTSVVCSFGPTFESMLVEVSEILTT